MTTVEDARAKDSARGVGRTTSTAAKSATACASSGMCDQGGRRPGAPCRRVSAGQGRTLSGAPELRTLCQGARLPGRLSERVAAHGRKHPDVTAGSSNLYELGSRGPREMGAARLRLRAGRFPRRRLLAGYIDHWSPRETKDFYDCIEWAGVQLWSNGKVGSTASRTPSTSGTWRRCSRPLAAMCIWKGRRLLPRADAPRRHPLPFRKTGTTCR